MYVCTVCMFICTGSRYWLDLSLTVGERWIYVFMYVCMCMYVCVFVCMYVCVYIFIYVCMQEIVNLYFPFICECRLQGNSLIDTIPHILTGQSHECRRFVVLMVNLVTRYQVSYINILIQKSVWIHTYLHTYIHTYLN